MGKLLYSGNLVGSAFEFETDIREDKRRRPCGCTNVHVNPQKRSEYTNRITREREIGREGSVGCSYCCSVTIYTVSTIL
jgi:hypothetical protein